MADDEPNNHPDPNREYVITKQDPGRRKFLLTGVAGLSAGVGAIVVGPSLPFLGYPLTNETVSRNDAFLPAGKPAQFSDVPVKVDLFADKVDAWNRTEDVKLGSAWVVRLGNELVAFSTICPHLGCAIDYDPERGKFKCPCHRSEFSIVGEVEDGPAPRAMDRLEVETGDKLVQIKFKRFKQGISDKEVV